MTSDLHAVTGWGISRPESPGYRWEAPPGGRLGRDRAEGPGSA
ncbi:hypothetical protein ABZY93_24660 [Streptomyces smyrnaeus]